MRQTISAPQKHALYCSLKASSLKRCRTMIPLFTTNQYEICFKRSEISVIYNSEENDVYNNDKSKNNDNKRLQGQQQDMENENKDSNGNTRLQEQEQ